MCCAALALHELGFLIRICTICLLSHLVVCDCFGGVVGQKGMFVGRLRPAESATLLYCNSASVIVGLADGSR